MKAKEWPKYILLFLRDFVLAVIVGAGVGAYSTVFGMLVGWAGAFRQSHEWITLLLPVAGLAIAALYRGSKCADSKGTNRVILSISEGDNIRLQMAPLITVSTVITHLFGGSAGREGAALQIGGCLGQNFAKLLKVNSGTMKILTMCGMSAAFSALFGTPVAAAIFSIEIVSVGVMYYSAIMPCAAASATGYIVSVLMGAGHERWSGIVSMAGFDWLMCLKVCALGVLCAILSIFFCIAMHRCEEAYRKFIPDQYIRALTGGFLVIAVTMVTGTADYQGAGTDIIEAALGGSAAPYAFALKIILTALTLGAGFKGGEIIPTIFAGATFGCVAGPLLGIPAPCAAALGVCGLFCGVTNAPLATLAICFELFGFEGALYFLLVAAISFRLSGYYSLYSSQNFTQAKSYPGIINRKSD